MDPVLGSLITTEAYRDAIHMALVPLIACDKFDPGEPFELEEGSTTNAVSTKSLYTGIGIVDPFLTTKVLKGDIFWGMLKQNTVTGMRHHFNHPSFPDDASNQPITPINVTPKSRPFTDILIAAANREECEKQSHEKWIRNFCKKYYLDFDDVVYQATHNGDICAGEEWDYDNDHDIDSFWEHLEGYTGNKYSETERESVYWRCAC